MQLVLASNSPRRKEILSMAGYDFIVKTMDTDESSEEARPDNLVEELSFKKAKAVADIVEDSIVIGSDTVVAKRNIILGKPSDKEHARKMIRLIAGDYHTVYTGVTIIIKSGSDLETITFNSATKVYVRQMSEEMIEEYICTEEPYDKAGAYGIQGIFAKYIERIEGDYNTVVGFPICEVATKLEEISSKYKIK